MLHPYGIILSPKTHGLDDIYNWENDTMNSDVEKIVKALREQGWEVDGDRRHYRAYPMVKSEPFIVFSKTPSDQRATKNVVSRLRRSGFVWPWNAQAKKAHRIGESQPI